jgi:hypothetical protein
MHNSLNSKLLDNKKGAFLLLFLLNLSGPDGTRTRDPMRDRHVF